MILRPGAVTADMLAEVCDKVVVSPAVVEPSLANNIKPESPGMKYKHYSPKADVVMVEGELSAFTEYVGANLTENTYSLIFDGDEKSFPYKALTYGADSVQQARLIFQRLRELDDIGADKVFVRAPSSEGVGLAVYNRLIRAAGFEVIRI